MKIRNKSTVAADAPATTGGGGRTTARPVLLTLNATLFERFLKRLDDVSFKGGELPQKLCRVQINDDAATTGELLVTLYPSNAFVRFVAAMRARLA